MTRDDDIRRQQDRQREHNRKWRERTQERRRRDESARTTQEPLKRREAATSAPRAAIRPKTAKRAGQEREYSGIRKEYLARHPFCHCCIEFEESEIRLATEIHHTAGREGELLCYEPFFMAVCNPCHICIHGQPITSTAAGMLLSRLESREQQIESLKALRGDWLHVKRELEGME